MSRMKNIHPQDWLRIKGKLQEAGWFVEDRVEYYRNTDEGREQIQQASRKAAKAAGEAAGILWCAANGVVRGGIQRMKDYYSIGNHAVHRRYREAGAAFVDMEKRRFHSAGHFAVGALRTAGDGAVILCGQVQKRESDEERTRRFHHGLRNCAIAGTAIVLGMEFYDVLAAEADDGVIDSTDGLAPNVPVEHLAGVQDGMLLDDSPANLHELAVRGELGHTEHLSDVVRSDAARTEFLELHGMEEAPPGWEVHHIIPLSEGGADSVDNMVLLRADDHAWITRMHEHFYGWTDARRGQDS